MINEPFRVTPHLPVEAYTTYALKAPKETHTRPATCEEVHEPCSKTDDKGERVCFEFHCGPHIHGWVTRVPFRSPLADFITGKTHGRHFVETTGLGDVEREFMFPPGQKCFRASQHVIEVGREPFASIRGGDWRGATTEVKRVGLPEWLERFALNQQAIKETHDRGAI